MAPRRRPTRIRSGVYNAWRPGLNANQQMPDVRRMMGRANVMSVNEIDDPLAKRIRQAGYGLYVNRTGIDNAVMWDRDKYRMQKSFSEKLNTNTFGGIFRQRQAAAVLLVDKKTGQKFWQVSTHLAAGSEGGSDLQKKRIQAQQIVAMNRLVHRLAKSGNPVLVSGDFNRGSVNLKGVKNAKQVDVMYSMYGGGAKHLRSSIVSDRSLNSDHGGLVSVFSVRGARKGGGGKKDDDKGGNGGGGNGGNNNGGNGGGNGGGGNGGPIVTDGSAYALLENLFESWGLPVGNDIQRVIRQAMKDGITPDKIDLIMPQLQETRTWKKRFKGNELLKAAGLSVLSVPEYLAVEKSYAQVLKNFGLPVGFYDDPADFASFIGKSVSANELQQRAAMFSDIAKREDPAVVEQLKSMGMTDGDILAYTMDATRAMPIIQKQYQTTLLGAAARRAGSVADNAYLGKLADLGITEQQASQGYGLIGEGLGTMERLGDIYGDEFGQGDFEAEVFESDGNAAQKRKRLASRERASFSGSSGVGQGSLTRNTGGSY